MLHVVSFSLQVGTFMVVVMGQGQYSEAEVWHGIKNPPKCTSADGQRSGGERGKQCRVCYSFDGMRYYRVTHRSGKERFPRVSETRRHQHQSTSHGEEAPIHMPAVCGHAKDLLQLLQHSDWL